MAVGLTPAAYTIILLKFQAIKFFISFGKHSVNKSESLLKVAFIFGFLHPKSWPDLGESNPNNFMRYYSHIKAMDGPVICAVKSNITTD